MTTPIPRDFVTIVSGIPRSGTSLAMQMIVAGGIPPVTDGLRAADEDNPRGYFELERVRQLRADKGWVADAIGKAVKVIHLLLTELPEDRPYRIVYVERDLREVVRSQAAMLARSGRQGGGLAPERLIAVYETQERQVRAWLDARRGFSVLRVRHADLLVDAAGQAHAINAFLGGDLDERKMASAVDPSLYRNRS